MCSKLIDCLKANNLHLTEVVSALNNSPCTEVSFSVLDINEIATKVYGEAKIPKPRTVNTVICDEKGHIYFVEFNQYYNDIQEFNKRYLTGEKSEKLEQKIDGTTETLTRINDKNNCDEELSDKLNKVKTIIVSEMTSEDFVKQRLAFSKELNIESISPYGEIGIMNCEEFADIFG